jgi:hypothetical protein
MEAKRARALDAAPAQASVRITVPAEHFVRLACGRETSKDASGSGEVVLRGDEELGHRVLGAMNIMV